MRRSALVTWLVCTGCPNDGPATGGDGSSSTGTADTTGGTEAPASGPLSCPAGESCTLVVVSQAFDDRIEFYGARGSQTGYRGAIDLDLKPNPMGDNSGDFLDEPYGLAIGDDGLDVLVGHYPARQLGSMVSFPHEFLAAQPEQGTIAKGTFFAEGSFTAPVRDIELGEEEPIFMLTHPSGRLLVGVFDNDLFEAESSWTNPGQILVVDPVSGEVGKRSLGMLGEDGCAGAWSLVWLDDAHTRIGVGCDGDEGAALLDVSQVGQGSVADAAASIDGCIADAPFPDKRVRYLAPDGDGGILLAENPTTATLDDGHLWRFDAECGAIGGPGTVPGELWEVREIVRLPFAGGTRWLMATGRTAARGLHVVSDGNPAQVCRTLDDLAPWWTAPDGGELHPFALALDHEGRGLAVGAGPVDPADDMPSDGRVYWLELDDTVDPCTATPVTSVVDLTASAPAVVADDPSTWRRGPNVVYVKQYGP